MREQIESLTAHIEANLRNIRDLKKSYDHETGLRCLALCARTWKRASDLADAAQSVSERLATQTLVSVTQSVLRRALRLIEQNGTI